MNKKMLFEQSDLTSLANSIRDRLSSNEALTLDQMSSLLSSSMQYELHYIDVEEDFTFVKNGDLSYTLLETGSDFMKANANNQGFWGALFPVSVKDLFQSNTSNLSGILGFNKPVGLNNLSLLTTIAVSTNDVSPVLDYRSFITRNSNNVRVGDSCLNIAPDLNYRTILHINHDYIFKKGKYVFVCGLLYDATQYSSTLSFNLTGNDYLGGTIKVTSNYYQEETNIPITSLTEEFLELSMLDCYNVNFYDSNNNQLSPSQTIPILGYKTYEINATYEAYLIIRCCQDIYIGATVTVVDDLGNIQTFVVDSDMRDINVVVDYKRTYTISNSYDSRTSSISFTAPSQTEIAYLVDFDFKGWDDNTDDETICKMVALADAEKIDLTKFWKVGDERTITVHTAGLSSVCGTFTYVTDQDRICILMDKDHYNLTTPTTANKTKCSFVVGCKNILEWDQVNNPGRIYYDKMNPSETSTNTGGWDKCPMRTWVQENLFPAIDDGIRPIFKQFQVESTIGDGSTKKVTSNDWLSFFSSVEILNVSAHSEGGSQIEYYKTASNRIKYTMDGNTSNPVKYWTRTAVGDWGGFRLITKEGKYSNYKANNYAGVSFFGCI